MTLALEQSGGLEVVGAKGSRSPRRSKRKRVHQVIPQVREQIPGLFDRVRDDEDLARTFGVSRLDLISEVLRDTRRMLRGGTPVSSGMPYLVRRSA